MILVWSFTADLQVDFVQQYHPKFFKHILQNLQIDEVVDQSFVVFQSIFTTLPSPKISTGNPVDLP